MLTLIFLLLRSKLPTYNAFFFLVCFLLPDTDYTCTSCSRFSTRFSAEKYLKVLPFLSSAITPEEIATYGDILLSEFRMIQYNFIV